MSEDEMIRVVLRITEDGLHGYYADGPVDFFVIDEACQRDRVYQCQDIEVEPAVIDALIGESRIGRIGDMPGAEDVVRRMLSGEPPKERPPLTEIGAVTASPSQRAPLLR